MSRDLNNSAVGPTWTQRIGFWLGLALFIGLLAVSPPTSMHRAARLHFRTELAADVNRMLARAGTPDAPPESAEYQAVEDRAVQARARIMMGAAAVTALVACWWITVAVPIPVTSLLPLLLLPLVGVLPVRQAAVPYADANVFLFMGGFVIALGVERWGLHRRIALHIVRIVGTGRSTIVLGFMIASAVLSMWISNTATTLMMLPIGLAVIGALADLTPQDGPRPRANFAAALMLGIAYAASVGGVGTPIGTPPNISFRGQLARLYPAAPEISFGQWLLLLLPLVCVFVPVIWLVLVRITCPVGRGGLRAGREVIRQQLAALGPMRRPEITMLIVFVATALLWITRSIPLGEDANCGWAALLEGWLAPADGSPSRFNAAFINDATVALLMAVLMFAIPAGRDAEGTPQRLMNWETATRLPWGILLLFGGGFAIAAGLRGSGLSLWCGQVFAEMDLHNPLLLVPGVCLLMTFLTEMTSNTATTEVMLPIVANVGQALGYHPLLLMLPATISASCAFMLPVATPPNAIVFGSGQVEMGRMVRTGLILNLIGVVLVTAVIYFLVQPVLGIDLRELPDWAR
ncbi:MAG: SLC13 family permease [Phycisphaerae bacterium]|jgi:sodium-dependent dicarboxylate transporter 2/3/5